MSSCTIAVSSHRERLVELGYTIVPNVLSKDEVSNYRRVMIEYFSCHGNRSPDGVYTQPDAINVLELETLCEVFGLSTLNQVLRGICDGELRYLHHFDVHMNMLTRYHDDTQAKYLQGEYKHLASESLHDKADYAVFTIAIYLQDHVDGGGLFLRPGSHRDLSCSDEVYIGPKAGDVLVFDARCVHKADTDSETMRDAPKRCAIFYRLGNNSRHSIAHALGAISRQLTQNRCTQYQLQPHVASYLESQQILY